MKRTNAEEEEVVDPLVKRIRDKVEAKKREQELAAQEARDFVNGLGLLSDENVYWCVKQIEERLILRVDDIEFDAIEHITITNAIRRKYDEKRLDNLVVEEFPRAFKTYAQRVVNLWNETHPTLNAKLVNYNQIKITSTK